MAHLSPSFSPSPFEANSGPPSLPHLTGSKDRTARMKTKSKEMAIDQTSNAFEASTVEELSNGTKRGLKTRHAQMIALGGAIGTGLFVSTGATLALGGPAFILSSFIFVSVLMYFIVTALVEIATSIPINGPSMSHYADRIVSKSLGFAMGWLYFYSLGILVPYEITAGALVIDYWNSPVNVGVWITILILLIIVLNLMPVAFYGEAEFWFASIKIITILGLLILSFILFWGGGPKQQGILGFHYWKNPGATSTWILDGDIGTFVAFLGTMVASVFPFTFAPELLIFTSGEMKAPEKNLPKAAKRYIWRLLIFYCGSVLAMTVICPFTDPNLTNGGAGAKSSPFVVGIQKAGIHSLGSVVNAAILTSAWSAGNAYLYMSSRALYSMALAGQAPAVFQRCNKHGVPYMAVGAAFLFAPLAYLNVGNSSSIVFKWFVNLTTTSGFISWICCCVVFLRFRKAFTFQGKDYAPYRSRVQPYGAWIALTIFTVLCLVNGFNVFLANEFTASGFLTAYIGLPVFVLVFLVHKVVARRSDPWLLPANDVNLCADFETDPTTDEENVKRWKRWAANFT